MHLHATQGVSTVSPSPPWRLSTRRVRAHCQPELAKGKYLLQSTKVVHSRDRLRRAAPCVCLMLSGIPKLTIPSCFLPIQLIQLCQLLAVLIQTSFQDGSKIRVHMSYFRFDPMSWKPHSFNIATVSLVVSQGNFLPGPSGPLLPTPERTTHSMTIHILNSTPFSDFHHLPCNNSNSLLCLVQNCVPNSIPPTLYSHKYMFFIGYTTRGYA